MAARVTPVTAAPTGQHPGSTLSRARLREDTPGCDRVIHLNNAGAALSPAVVTERMVRHLRLEGTIGGYEAAAEVLPEIESGRALAAALLGTSPDRVAFVESATAGLHRVLSTLRLRRGDRVLVAGSEYASTVLPLLQLTHRVGIRLEVIPDDPSGVTDPQALARMMDSDVRLVCAVHVPSHNGLVNDIAALGREVAGSRAWYLVDACQSVGQIPVDMRAAGADFVIASGRKYLRGPRGSGLLAVSDRALSDVDAYPVDVAGARWTGPEEYELAPSARRFESFESSVAVVLGLVAAIQYATDLGLPALSHAIGRNAEYLRSHLASTGPWRVGDRGIQRSGIVTARHPRVPAGAAVAALGRAGINAWEVGRHTNPRDLGDESVLRLSPHAYNTRTELDRTLQVLADL